MTPHTTMRALGWKGFWMLAMLSLFVGIVTLGARMSGRSDAALDALRDAGASAAITVFPTEIGDTAVPRVGEAVGLLLERAGMRRLDVREAPCITPPGLDAAEWFAAAAECVRVSPPAGHYALLTQFIGTRDAGFTEVRAAIVSRAGDIVWKERLARGDAAFDRAAPTEPLQCCMLVVTRLRAVLRLPESAGADPVEGPIARRMREAAGVPDQEEMDRINRRGETFRDAASRARVVVFPPHVGPGSGVESARRIAAQLAAAGWTGIQAAATGPEFPIARDINEQKALWSLARGLGEAVRRNPPDADYVVMADYLRMSPEAFGAVHTVVCDTQGRIVLADLQNSHSKDFQAIAPRTPEECDRLVVARLRGLQR